MSHSDHDTSQLAIDGAQLGRALLDLSGQQAALFVAALLIAPANAGFFAGGLATTLRHRAERD